MVDVGRAANKTTIAYLKEQNVTVLVLAVPRHPDTAVAVMPVICLSARQSTCLTCLYIVLQQQHLFQEAAVMQALGIAAGILCIRSPWLPICACMNVRISVKDSSVTQNFLFSVRHDACLPWCVFTLSCCMHTVLF